MDLTARSIGHYELRGVIGQRTNGLLYEAEDLRLGRRVALRLVPPDVAGDPATRARLNRELTLLASLDHPSVPPIYEAGEVDGQIYVASRYIEGTSLADLIRDIGPLEPERAVRILNQAASALHAAHALGIIHRNVKPSRVLITPHDHAYLTDFGVARRMDDQTGLTVQANVLESFDYVAPEYIEGGAVDARIDIYGLGCVLYEALRGEVPYPRSTPAAKLYAHRSAELPSVRDGRPDISPQLDAVIRRAMAKRPEDRQASAAEFAFETASAVGLSGPLWVARDGGISVPVPVAPVADQAAAPPAAAEPPAEAPIKVPETGFYDPVYFNTNRGGSGRRTLVWAVAVLVFLAAPLALIIALASSAGTSI